MSTTAFVGEPHEEDVLMSNGGDDDGEEEVGASMPMATPSPPLKSNRSNITPDAFAPIGLFDDSQ